MTSEFRNPNAEPSGPPDLEGYDIIGEIGRGGYGVVYRAEQKVLGRTVAIKNLNVDLSNDPGLLERFIREARIVAQIGGHENIVQIYDVKEYKGQPCIIMEFVEGRSLADMLYANERIELVEAVRVTSYTARALQHAHEMGIIHRDIKPENVMISRKGRVKVMDFGIAFSGDMPRLTQRGFAVGTPQFMSPEQLRGRTVDGRSDIYSLSVLFYYLITGKLPFDDADPRELGLKHIRQPPQPPSELNPEIPEEIEEIVLKGLAKKPEDRFQTAAELEQAFQRYLLNHSGPSLTTAFAAYRGSRESPKPDDENLREKSERPSPPSRSQPQTLAFENSHSESELQSGSVETIRSSPEMPSAHGLESPPSHEEPALAEERSESSAGLLIVMAVLAVLALVALGFSHYKRESKRQFDALFAKGNEFLAQSDLDGAEAAFREAAALRPDSTGPINMIALVERKRANYTANMKVGQSLLDLDPEAAAEAFETALRIMPNDTEAQRLLEEARGASEGESASMIFERAMGLYTGTSGQMDHVEARQLFARAAEHVDPVMRLWLAIMLQQGLADIPQDAERAERIASAGIDDLQELAERGDSLAAFVLGYAFEIGLGIEPDPAKAAEWYSKAAWSGQPAAMARLGSLYLDNSQLGSASEAAEWLEKAAASGHAEAQYRLGRLYDEGRGVAQDSQRAQVLYRQAAELGHEGARAALIPSQS